ncbi:MAG: cation-translocating P-type ATPase [bacterium]|nr:cation-translocating P-type ATPase [bacterium]
MEKGLDSLLAKEKLKTFGRNEITTKRVRSPLSLFLAEFPNFINGILVMAGIFSLIIKDYLDGIFILAILITNSFFGFLQKYKAEKSLEKLKNFVKPVSRVIRDGKEIQIPTVEIVPEDLVLLSEGDLIPADGYLLVNRHLEIDESLLTGESIPVVKEEKEEIFAGALVTKGRGILKVEKTGMKTKLGEIAKTLSELETDETPLQKRMNTLGKILSIAAVLISALLIPIGIYQGKMIFPLILLAVSVGIAAIPEGLPAVITIALSLGAGRMAKKKAIVRDMQAIETLGAIQILLTDKTGTLTQNLMRVKKFWPENEKNIPDMVKACVLGNTATLIEKSDGEKERFDIVGDKTDGALLLWAKQNSKDNSDNRQIDGKIIDEYVFDVKTKTVTTLWQLNSQSYAFVRGAPETIIEKSKLNKKEANEINSLFEKWAKEGLRVIALGMKELSSNKLSSKNLKRSDLESDLKFLGLIGIYDPPREEVRKSVEEAKIAGIKTIMVTGDNEFTALAIAKEVGLIEENEDVITGDELKKMTDKELEKIILKTRIFARSKPEDKLRLVETFKKLGFVVGVTGDGVNDALALKRADVGIAMGESGTDVAKEASDIVLTDDNFSTLVKAIEEGRIIYHNIVKSIVYLLSGNLSEISLIFFSLVLGLPSPLLPTQILWINLVTDGIPALALASDTKESSLLEEKPRDPKEPILNRKRIIFISLVGFGLSAFLIVLFKFVLQNSNETFARTVVFNVLVFSHMMIAFIVRGKSMFKMNKLLVFGVLGILILQGIITTIPFFQSIFHLGLR